MKSERLHWTGALAVACAIASFGSTSDWPGAARLLLGMAIAGIFLRSAVRIPRGLLPPIALVLTILVTTRIPATPPGSFIGAPSYIVGLLLAFLILIFLFRKNTAGEDMFLVCLSSLLAMDAGMTIYTRPYAWYLLAHFLFFCLYLRATYARADLRKTVYVLAALGLTIVLAGVTALFLGWTETKLNQLLSLAEGPLSGTTAFSPRTRLTSVEYLNKSGKVVMRVTTPSPPSHLVGRCYVKYADGTWESPTGRRPVEPLEGAAAAGRFPEGSGRVFALRDPKGSALSSWSPKVVDRVGLVTTGSGTIFAPREAVLAAAELPSLLTDECGVIFHVRYPQFTGEYLVARGGAPSLEAEKSTAQYLQLPASLPAVVGRLARSVTRDCRTAEEKADAVRSFFHGNFTYGASGGLPADRDPLEEFLVKRPPAHCEFFATGMTVMLRSLKIPARYVTGFLVKDYNRTGGYYMVKERDAHAWTEVYYPRRGWVTYDPTPPDALLSTEDAWTKTTRELLDIAALQVQKLLAAVSGKSPLELLRMLLAGLQGAGAWLLENPLRLLILLVLAAPSLLRARPWRRPARRREKAVKEDGRVTRVKELLKRVEDLLEASGLKRPGNLTLLEWAGELSTKEECGSAAEFLVCYSAIRYGRTIPSKEDIALLEERQRSVESAWQARKK